MMYTATSAARISHGWLACLTSCRERRSSTPPASVSTALRPSIRSSGGAGTALVGDGPTVAARVQEYADLGIDTFIFSGYPHLEESYRVAAAVTGPQGNDQR